MFPYGSPSSQSTLSNKVYFEEEFEGKKKCSLYVWKL